MIYTPNTLCFVEALEIGNCVRSCYTKQMTIKKFLCVTRDNIELSMITLCIFKLHA